MLALGTIAIWNRSEGLLRVKVIGKSSPWVMNVLPVDNDGHPVKGAYTRYAKLDDLVPASDVHSAQAQAPSQVRAIVNGEYLMIDERGTLPRGTKVQVMRPIPVCQVGDTGVVVAHRNQYYLVKLDKPSRSVWLLPGEIDIYTGNL